MEMDQKSDIKNRQDIKLLVVRFYEKIRKDPILGPIFNGIINDWEAHFELLTDFWESQLLTKRGYLAILLPFIRKWTIRLTTPLLRNTLDYGLIFGSQHSTNSLKERQHG